MSRFENEILTQFDWLEKQLVTVDDPHHGRILRAFRRHALLESIGRVDELVGPDLMVDVPRYRFYEAGQVMTLAGQDQVRSFYESLGETGTRVMWLTHADAEAQDWGFSGEFRFSQLVPGSLLSDHVFGDRRDELEAATGPVSVDGAPAAAGGAPADVDPDAMYLAQSTVAMAWPFSADGQVMGEHCWELTPRTWTKVDPADVVTLERARELLTPELDRLLP